MNEIAIRGPERRRRPSRGMISGELSWAFVALAFAWAGSGLWPFEGGYLARTLTAKDLDEAWPWLTLGPSLWLVAASGWELVGNRRRDWPAQKVVHAVGCRFWANTGLLFCWVYILYALTRLGFAGVLSFVAAGGCAFAAWFIVENRRVLREFR
jgi:hypothetical protein